MIRSWNRKPKFRHEILELTSKKQIPVYSDKEERGREKNTGRLGIHNICGPFLTFKYIVPKG